MRLNKYNYKKILIIYFTLICVVILLLKIFPEKRMLILDEDFNADVIFSSRGGWRRWAAKKEQAFVNRNGELQLNFNEKHWISAHFLIPEYVPDGEYKFIITARSVKQRGRITIYDRTASRVIFRQAIPISDENRRYSFQVKMPGEKNHQLWLRCYQHVRGETGGELYVDRIMVYRL